MMKKYILILCLFCLRLLSQTTIMLDVLPPRPMPLFGFNVMEQYSKGHWANQHFLDTLSSFKANVNRFRGGGHSQWSDWATGHTIDSTVWPTRHITGFPPQPNLNYYDPGADTNVSQRYVGATHANYLSGMTSTGLSNALMVVNLLSSPKKLVSGLPDRALLTQLQYQTEGLRDAKNIGIPINYVELGNEIYFGVKQPGKEANTRWGQYTSCLRDLSIYADSIHLQNSSALVSVPYGWKSANQGWADTLNAMYNTNQLHIDAVAIHPYQDADLYFNSAVSESNQLPITSTDLDTTFADSYDNYNSQVQPAFNGVSPNLKIWLTEFGLGAGDNSKRLNRTWAHALFNIQRTLLLMKEPRVTMLNCFGVFGNGNSYEFLMEDVSTTPHTFNVTPMGKGMRELYKVMAGKQTATLLKFNNCPTFGYGSLNNNSALLGWEFTPSSPSSPKQAVIINTSSLAIAASVSSNSVLGTSSYNYKIFTASNPYQKYYSGVMALNTTTGTSASSITFAPYSLTILTAALVATDIDELKNNLPIQVYPIPASDVLNINLKDENKRNSEFTVELIDVNGKEILSKKYSVSEFNINVKEFREGMYILKVKTEEIEYMQKVIIQK